MGADKADEANAGVVMDFYDEAVGVAIDVEDHPVAGQRVGGRIAVFDVRWPGPLGRRRFIKLRLYGGLGIGVGGAELAERATGYHSYLKNRWKWGEEYPQVPVLGTFSQIRQTGFVAARFDRFELDFMLIAGATVERLWHFRRG